MLGLQAQVVDGAAQLLLDALERRGQPARPVRGLFPRGRGVSRSGPGSSRGQVLEGLVVQVAGNAAALGLPDLAELLSVFSRSIAVASTLATACRKFASSSEKVRWVPVCAPSAP